MLRVIVESPYAGDVERNLHYAQKCLLDSLKRGEAPFASHLLYTQVLNDKNPFERRAGMEAGFAWGKVAEMVAVYEDYGISKGMEQGILAAKDAGLTIVYRKILPIR